jgi:hypothetical protein
MQLLDYARWVLEEAAAEITRHPPFTATPDFVAYPSLQGQELIETPRFVAPSDVQRSLERQALLVDDPEQLEGSSGFDLPLSDS